MAKKSRWLCHCAFAVSATRRHLHFEERVDVCIPNGEPCDFLGDCSNCCSGVGSHDNGNICIACSADGKSCIRPDCGDCCHRSVRESHICGCTPSISSCLTGNCLDCCDETRGGLCVECITNEDCRKYLPPTMHKYLTERIDYSCIGFAQ